MNLRQKILIFRTCLAVLVTLKRLAYDQMNNGSIKRKTINNLDCLIKPVNDEVNFLYAEESKQKVKRK